MILHYGREWIKRRASLFWENTRNSQVEHPASQGDIDLSQDGFIWKSRVDLSLLGDEVVGRSLWRSRCSRCVFLVGVNDHD
jgi:hypothetical protein